MSVRVITNPADDNGFIKRFANDSIIKKAFMQIAVSIAHVSLWKGLWSLLDTWIDPEDSLPNALLAAAGIVLVTALNTRA